MPEQEARYEADAWEEKIVEYVGTRARVTIGEVANGALFLETRHVGTADQRRIAAVLTNRGWRREKKDRTGKRWWSQP
jgi:hypothetical protein